MSAEIPDVVRAFIGKRPEYVTALKNSRGADSDYWRWSGHAEARRQLCADLEELSPACLCGHHTQRVIAP